MRGFGDGSSQRIGRVGNRGEAAAGRAGGADSWTSDVCRGWHWLARASRTMAAEGKLAATLAEI